MSISGFNGEDLDLASSRTPKKNWWDRNKVWIGLFVGAGLTFAAGWLTATLWGVNRLVKSVTKAADVAAGFPKAAMEWVGEEFRPTMEMIRDRPRLCRIANFLTPAECDHLIQVGDPKMTESKVQAGNGYAPDPKVRSSHSAYLPRHGDDSIKTIEKKASLLAGVPLDHMEPLQVVRYKPGQKFNAHHDYLHGEAALKNGGQRRITVFVYLNHAPSEGSGGNTRFPKLDLSFQPKKGDALLWYNADPTGKLYDETLHSGEPPEGWTKFGCNIWMRERPYQ